MLFSKESPSVLLLYWCISVRVCMGYIVCCMVLYTDTLLMEFCCKITTFAYLQLDSCIFVNFVNLSTRFRKIELIMHEFLNEIFVLIDGQLLRLQYIPGFILSTLSSYIEPSKRFLLSLITHY